MAFFRKKKDDAGQNGGTAGADAAAADGGFKPEPDKARKWFEHAKSMADRFDHGYALFLYANGIKFDPEAMSAHEAMLEAAVKYMNQGGKPASGKDVRTIADGSPISKMAAAEFAWMKDYQNASLALKTLEAAAKAEQFEFGNWIAPRVLGLIRRQKKVSKSGLVAAKELFKKVSAWDEAIVAGELALQLDPTDNELAHELKDISAQRAMDQGGYEGAAGAAGGFRKFIKDADKQRDLQDAEAISAGMDVEQRNLERAKRAYEEDPTMPDVINQYGQLLKRRSTPEALELAREVYTKGFQATGEYRFRMMAGDIQIESLTREVRTLAEKLESSPDDEALKAKHDEKNQELLKLQAEEYGERVRKYPTDRQRKYDLGRVEFDLGRFEEAMAQFQAAKEEPKLRVRAGHMLGRCFAKENWHPEAIAEYRDALGAIDATNQDVELVIRYDLMVSLIAQAAEQRSIDVAREALEICSGIARKNITYRDIRNRRKEIDQLVRDLSGESE